MSSIKFVDSLDVIKYDGIKNIADFEDYTLVRQQIPAIGHTPRGGYKPTTVELWEGPRIPGSGKVADLWEIEFLSRRLEQLRATYAAELAEGAIIERLAFIRSHRLSHHIKPMLRNSINALANCNPSEDKVREQLRSRIARMNLLRQRCEETLDEWRDHNAHTLQTIRDEAADLQTQIDTINASVYGTPSGYLTALNNGEPLELGARSDASHLSIVTTGVADITGTIRDERQSHWSTDRASDAVQNPSRLRIQVQWTGQKWVAEKNFNYWSSRVNPKPTGPAPSDPNAPRRAAARTYLEQLTGTRITDIRRQAENGYHAAIAANDKGLAEIWRIIGSTLATVGR